MTGFAADETSFAKANGLMRVLAGLRVDTSQVERAAEAPGAEDERHRVESTGAFASTLYLGMDGTGVPVRPSECAGRPDKQLDGWSKTREVKLVTLWTAEKRDPHGVPMRDPGSVSHSAAIESAASRDTDKEQSDFAQRVEREARRRGFPQAQRRVILGDGARWIWGIAQEVFPGAIQIVDLFHTKEHLWGVAKAIYGAPGSLAEKWTE